MVAYANLGETCAGSAIADIPARWKLPQYLSTWRPKTTSQQKRGPHLVMYPKVSPNQIPSGCNPSGWAQSRLMQVVMDTIALGTNYCHHHAPAYQTPPSVQATCQQEEPGTDDVKCVCSAAGMTKPKPWQGVDCSNFVAFVYNLAFGFYPTSDIGQQACHPTLAPGRLLSGITTSSLDQLSPGDLLFITPSRRNNAPPVRVSHVVIWTGWTVDFAGTGPLSKSALMANVPEQERAGSEKCMENQRKLGKPVYIIADSHHNGPALRPFCGWYMNSFSHARRVINPSTALPRTDSNIATWDDGSRKCLSKWALQR